jgi:bacterioferritin-associated ferredoxin
MKMNDCKDLTNIIICRCNDVTLQEIEEAIDTGITEPEELKRFLHIGMGPCQGRTCMRMVRTILARKTGKPISEIPSSKKRPPLVPLLMSQILGDSSEQDI